MGQGESQEHEHGRHDDLHGHNPPALGFHHINYRAPNALEEPGKIEQCREKGHVAVGNAHLGEHHHRDVVDHKVGHPLGKIKGGHPPPRGPLIGSCQILFHIFIMF